VVFFITCIRMSESEGYVKMDNIQVFQMLTCSPLKVV
jgi:hypothetical protein